MKAKTPGIGVTHRSSNGVVVSDVGRGGGGGDGSVGGSLETLGKVGVLGRVDELDVGLEARVDDEVLGLASSGEVKADGGTSGVGSLLDRGGGECLDGESGVGGRALSDEGGGDGVNLGERREGGVVGSRPGGALEDGRVDPG